MIDGGAVSALGVSAVGQVPLMTPAGQTASLLYPVRLTIMGVPGQPPVITVNLTHVTVGPLAPQGFLCLIGRDILQRATLFYNGPDDSFSIAF